MTDILPGVFLGDIIQDFCTIFSSSLDLHRLAENCWENTPLFPSFPCYATYPHTIHRSKNRLIAVQEQLLREHLQSGALQYLPHSRPATEATMIGTSRAEYIFIRFCIIGLHYLAPLCLLYCALVIALYGFKTAITSPVPLVIESIAVAESLFFLFVYLPYRYRLQREAIHPPAPTRDERRELFAHCNANIADPEGYLQKWFLGADLKDIKRENVKEFLLWAFFNRGGPPGDDDEELEEYVIATEKLLGKPIEEGRGKAQCLRLTLDRVDMLHRSLVWYCVS